MTLFHEHYTMGQDISLAFLALLYIFQGLKYVLIDSKKKEQKENAKKVRATSQALSSDSQRLMGTIKHTTDSSNVVNQVGKSE